MKQIKTFDQYVAAAARTAGDISLTICALGLAGESGEIADHIKKHFGHGHPLDKTAVATELGDLLWYIAVMSETLQIPMDEIAQMNIEKLKKRYPNGFSSAASINRSQTP